MGDPYVITTASQLDEMKQDIEAHYILGNDIDASAYVGYEPTGNWSGNPYCDLTTGGYCAFQGSFDGMGYTITDLTIEWNDPTFEKPGGLFGVVYNPSYIGNVTLENLIVRPLSDYQNNCCQGGLIGGDDSDVAGRFIENVHIINAQIDPLNLTGENGGIIGYTGGIGLFPYFEIRNSSFQGTIGGNRYIGGIVGVPNNNDIYSGVAVDVVINFNNSFGTSSSIGGAIGSLLNAVGVTLNDVYVKGEMNIIQNSDISVSQSWVGGIYGTNNAVQTGFITLNNVYVQMDLPDASVLTNTFVEVIGKNNDVCTNVYYDSDIMTDVDGTTCDNFGGTTALTSAQMTQQASFVGFDFVNTWTIQELVSTPTLQSTPSACTPDYVYTGYGTATCLINDTSTTSCNAVTDNNACGIPYAGDYTEFANQTGVCDFCTPDPAPTCAVEDTSQCGLTNFTANVTCIAGLDNNGCFATTGLPSDELDLDSLYPPYSCSEFTNDQFNGAQALMIALLPLLILIGLMFGIPQVRDTVTSKLRDSSTARTIAGVVSLVIVLVLLGLLL